SDREAAACSGDRQCVKDAQAKWNASAKHIDDEASACKARVQSQTKAEPPPYLNWKPGDPSPQAKDGRRYIMSCSGQGPRDVQTGRSSRDGTEDTSRQLFPERRSLAPSPARGAQAVHGKSLLRTRHRIVH